MLGGRKSLLKYTKFELAAVSNANPRQSVPKRKNLPFKGEKLRRGTGLMCRDPPADGQMGGGGGEAAREQEEGQEEESRRIPR